MSTIKSSAENLTLNADGANNDVIIQSNGSTKVTVDGATGNVGIGTSSPATKLDISGTAGITSFTGTTKLGVVSRGSTGATDYSGYDFIGNTQSNPVARVGVITTGGGSKLSFGTSNAYASGITNTAMTIDQAGNVGIGTTAPDTELHVHGTGALLSSDSYFVAQIQTDRNDNGSSDDAILQFVNGSGKTVKGEIRWDESSNTFELGHGDNANHIVIDSTGAVTMPSQPTASFGWTTHPITTTTIVPAETILVNIGSHLTSAGRFTAPVAGTYEYGFSAMMDNDSDTMKVDLLKNGSLFDVSTRVYTNSVQYSRASITGYITLSANDYLEWKNQNAVLHGAYGQAYFKLVA